MNISAFTTLAWPLSKLFSLGLTLTLWGKLSTNEEVETQIGQVICLK